MNYSFKGNRILVIDKKEIKFNHQIYEVVDFGSVLTVGLGSGGDCIDMAKEPRNNIYAITDTGEFLWTIQEVMSQLPFFQNDPFDGFYRILEKTSDCTIKIWEFNGYTLTIDVFTGRIIDLETSRF